MHFLLQEKKFAYAIWSSAQFRGTGLTVFFFEGCIFIHFESNLDLLDRLRPYYCTTTSRTTSRRLGSHCDHSERPRNLSKLSLFTIRNKCIVWSSKTKMAVYVLEMTSLCYGFSAKHLPRALIYILSTSSLELFCVTYDMIWGGSHMFRPSHVLLKSRNCDNHIWGMPIFTSTSFDRVNI